MVALFRMEKICVDDVCENPCSRIAPHLMVCDCAQIDPDTGFASEDRCQLCCYDFNTVSTPLAVLNSSPTHPNQASGRRDGGVLDRNCGLSFGHKSSPAK